MLIAVAETHPPKAGGRVAHVVAADGAKFEIWPDKLGGIQVGGRYEVEVEDREYNGRTFRKIVKATPVNGVTSHTANGNGTTKPAGNGNGHAPATGPVSATEAAFVREVLVAMIMKGDVVATNKRQMLDTTLMLRCLYGATFGGRAKGNGGGDE